MSEDDVRGYLTENIHYQLDAGCMEGLQLFYRYAAEIGALPRCPPALQFVGAEYRYQLKRIRRAIATPDSFDSFRALCYLASQEHVHGLASVSLTCPSWFAVFHPAECVKLVALDL